LEKGRDRHLASRLPYRGGRATLTKHTDDPAASATPKSSASAARCWYSDSAAPGRTTLAAVGRRFSRPRGRY